MWSREFAPASGILYNHGDFDRKKWMKRKAVYRRSVPLATVCASQPSSDLRSLPTRYFLLYFYTSALLIFSAMQHLDVSLIWLNMIGIRNTFNTVTNFCNKEELSLFVFISCPVPKAAGGARGGSTALAAETLTSTLVGSWWRQGIACAFTHVQGAFNKFPDFFRMGI